MAVDLHTHSTYSDGTVSPSDIVERGVAAGLSAVALTDHDGFEGLAEAAGAAAGRIGFIPGVELSVDWNGRAMHLLVYWVEDGSGPLQDALAGIRDSRWTRNVEMIEALQALGIEITVEEVLEEAGHGVVGRPHIAAVLCRSGVTATNAEAFEQYLGSGGVVYRQRKRLLASDAVSLARASGGVTSVAHPHTVAESADGFRELFEGVAALGVNGIECHYVDYPPDLRTRLAAWADDLELVPTGGSDYHGAYKPGIEVGVGRGDLRVPDESLERLAERRP
ncbi:MAG: PHP domain-containing protein [Acidimicrobiia bacterium]